MEELKKIKKLVNDNITRHDRTRHCEVANHFSHWVLHNCIRHCEEGVARRGNLLNGLLRHFVPRNDKDSGTPQSLINDKGLFAYSPIGLFAFINHFTHLTHLRKRVAFTLAEVLITLAVIGVVAAMTIPTLVNNYKTQVNVVKIKKFYSMFNQAIKLSEVDNGSIDTWFLECGSSGDPTCTIDEVEDWYNNYLGKYIKTTKVEKDYQSTPNCLYLHFADGSVIRILANIRDVMFYCSYYKGVNHNDSFPFILHGKNAKANNGIVDWGNCSNYLDTYCFRWDGTRESLIEKAASKSGASAAYPCIKLLELDGWNILSDNPCKYY